MNKTINIFVSMLYVYTYKYIIYYIILVVLRIEYAYTKYEIHNSIGISTVVCLLLFINSSPFSNSIRMPSNIYRMNIK